MNGVALLVALSTLGVDHTWRHTADGQVEYVLQVEPVYLQALAEGKEIHSELPDDIERVDRLCIRIGSDKLEALPQTAPHWPELNESAEQQAAQTLVPDAPLAIYVQANGDAFESYDLTHGWRLASPEQTTYLIQLDPRFLKRLADGDEIYAAVRPEAGSLRAFKLTSGSKLLPRDASKPPVMTVAQLQTENSRGSSPAAEMPPTTDLTGGNSVYGGVGTADSTTRGATELGNVPSTAPPHSPWNLNDGGANLYAAGQEDEGRLPVAPTQPPGSSLLEVPSFDRGEFEQSRGSAAGQTGDGVRSSTRRGNRGAGAAAAPRSGRQPQSLPARQDELYPDDNNASYEPSEEPPPRLASARTTAAGSFDQELTRGGTTAPQRGEGEGDKAKTPSIWVLGYFFALFFSIGGNVYLAWTAAEFYNRYRLAVDRLRSAGR